MTPARDDDLTSDRADLAALLALLAVPWSVQVYAAGAPTLVFPWGLVGLVPFGVTTLPDFLFRYTAGLPEFVLAWPLGTLLYAGALASAAVSSQYGRLSERLTPSQLVAVGFVAYGIGLLAVRLSPSPWAVAGSLLVFGVGFGVATLDGHVRLVTRYSQQQFDRDAAQRFTDRYLDRLGATVP